MSWSRLRDGLVALGLRAGVQIRSRKHLLSERFLSHVRRRGIGLVVDVGANRGQFAIELMKAGFEGTIVSFEPIPELQAELSRRASAMHSRWIVAGALALSDHEGSATLSLMEGSALSSLLVASDLLRSATPAASTRQHLTVPLRRLADVLPEHLGEMPEHYAIKLDTQGTELDVLRGADLPHGSVDLVQIELSTIALYDDQCMYDEVDAWMREQGFVLIDLEPGYRDPRSGDVHQFDAIYARSERLEPSGPRPKQMSE